MKRMATRRMEGNPPASPWGSSLARIGVAGLLGAAAILFFHPGAMDWERVKWSLLFATALPVMAVFLRNGLVSSVRSRLSPALLSAALVLFFIVFSSFRTGQASLEEYRLVAGIAILLVVAVVVRDGAWERPWSLPLILLAAGAVAAVCALLQSAGMALFGIDNPGNEAVGTLGNTNAAAEVFALLIPLAAAGVLSARRGVRVTAIPALALLAAGLFATGGRGGLLAALTGLGIVAGLALFARSASRGQGAGVGGEPLSRCWRKAILPAVLFALGAGGATLVGDGPGTTFKNIESDESVFSLDYPTNRQRLLVWESTCAMIADHPFMGAGPGRFRALFPPYRNPEEARIRGRMGAVTEVDNPHNEFLWAAAEGGIGAGAALLFFLLLLLRQSRSAAASATDAERAVHAAGLGGVVGAFVVLSLFRAPLHNPAAAAILFSAAGMIEATRFEMTSENRAAVGALLVRLVGGGALILVAFFGIQTLRSDLLFAGVGSASQLGSKEYDQLERAFAIDKGNIELANFLGQVAARINEMGDGEGDLHSEALRYLRLVLRKNPYHPGALHTLARIRLLCGDRAAGRHLLARALTAEGSEADADREAAAILKEKELYSHAAFFLEKASTEQDRFLLDEGTRLLESNIARGAAIYADEWLKSYPLDVEALHLSARAIRALGTGGEDRAFQLMQIAISLDWFDEGQWEKAGKSATRALRYGDVSAGNGDVPAGNGDVPTGSDETSLARLLEAAAAAALGSAFEPPGETAVKSAAIRERLRNLAKDRRLSKEIRDSLKEAGRAP
jgi:O-antigen ligase